MWQQLILKNILGPKSSPPVHFNATDLHCKIGITVKNEILASTSILIFLGLEIIKLSGLGTDLG